MTDTSTDPHVATALIVALADERDALLAERDALQWKLDCVLNDTGQRSLLDKIDALMAERDALLAEQKKSLWAKISDCDTPYV